ncbi:MAG TPA: DASS family sodium-coupled anion symporter [Candidatus Sulfomarinibacteraceae bacterium]|nr:DASS family sodium-coupled anion symporter [Candidatus Sulfomarinibacteraceae bacterium]
MTAATKDSKPTGYDRTIDWRLFAIPLGLFILIMLMPTPRSMLRVGAEFSLGPTLVRDHFAREFFGTDYAELNQWQVQTVQMMSVSTDRSSFSHEVFMTRNRKWCEKNEIASSEASLAAVREAVAATDPARFEELLRSGHRLKTTGINLENLSEAQAARAERAGFHVKTAVAIVAFVVGCFVTEAIPLPMVAFCIGVIALLTGIFDREVMPSLYWSDATWFIMGSLMFAAAFVKTGVDRRIGVMMFGKLKKPSVRWVTFVIIVIIAPLTMFMSDHALAAMFLPIGIMLYTTATAAVGDDDPELGKMLMITIAMACNLGGSLAPSGAARNIIMMGYAEDMYGITIGFAQWMIYCVPFLFFVIPLTWFVINWRFKPQITDLGPSIRAVQEQIQREGGRWSRAQVVSLVIFLVMLASWITENNLLYQLTGIRIGIGVLAVMGAIAYMLAGIVSWRDYQTRVDWGVVWLYAGAIIFGRILITTGGAYWIASSIVEVMVPLGLGSGLGLLLSGNIITGLVTQIMADGPACAAVGPVTLAMAGIVHPGTAMIPFVAMSTAIASSLAYCLIIGTPPNAIVYASGYLTQRDYLRAGCILFVTNLAVLLLMAATYWRWLGWSGLPMF